MAINNLTDEEISGPVGYLAVCLAHIRTGTDIHGVETGLVCAAPPTQAEADIARHMISRLDRVPTNPEENQMRLEDQIFIVMANRVAELEASIPEHLAGERPDAADMALYGARELRNILDLTAGPRWPVWVAEQRTQADRPKCPLHDDPSLFGGCTCDD